MFRLYAGIAEGFGKAIIDILAKQYPDQVEDMKSDPNGHPGHVGNKLMAIARRQNQGDEQRSMDAIQDWFTYIVSSNWNFAKDFPTWKEALNRGIYPNVKNRSISKSKETSRKKKYEKSIDDAYGARGEGGGDPEGGEGRMPTPDESSLAKALDDQTAIKSFVELIDDLIPDLRATLSEDTRALFDLIFFDEVGSFGSDIKENMEQATKLKEKEPELFEEHAKRWSGFVGDTRKKLLDEIWKFIDDHMTPDEYESLKEMFFADTTPQEVRKIERKKVQNKKDEQQGKDERKLARYKWQEGQGVLDPKEMKSYKNLEEKLRSQGVNIDDIWPEENPSDKAWPLHSKAASSLPLAKIAARVAASWI